MNLRIRLPAECSPVHIIIDAREDGSDGMDFEFKEGRLIPLYYLYPGERRGYVLQAGGANQGALPNTEGGYKILLAVRGSEVERLQKAMRKLHEEVGALGDLPQGFWAKLGILVAQRSFRPFMVKELCVATMQRRELLQELDAGVGVQ